MDIKNKAKEIRKILKKEFPTQKFSVRMDNIYAIFVRWENGPERNQVENLVKQFESYERCEVTGEILQGGNDYVFCERSKK